MTTKDKETMEGFEIALVSSFIMWGLASQGFCNVPTYVAFLTAVSVFTTYTIIRKLGAKK